MRADLQIQTVLVVICFNFFETHMNIIDRQIEEFLYSLTGRMGPPNHVDY